MIRTITTTLLQLFAAKRTGIVTFTLAYTFSKALGDSNGNNTTLENWRNLQYNYGYLSNDRRHAFRRDLRDPGARISRAKFVVREAAGGWQISGVARLQSGGYFNVQATSPLGLGTVRADRVAGVPIYINNHAGKNGYVTKGAFAANPKTVARFGNAPNGAVLGPGLAQTDATLSKFFPGC